MLARPSVRGIRGMRRLWAARLVRHQSTASSSSSSPETLQATPGGPRAAIDLGDIRRNVELHAANCVRRNYGGLREHPARIAALMQQQQARQPASRALRQEANAVRRRLVSVPETRDAESEDKKKEEETRESLLETARQLKTQLAAVAAEDARLQAEIQSLAAALPNRTSDATPDGAPRLLSYIGAPPPEAGEGGDRWRSHVHVGAELGLLDFAAASAASGWGWYYLLGDGARLEQALVQHALAAAHRAGWQLVSPPSVVRSSVSAACGFQPRDQGGEQQTYTLDSTQGSLSLTATAEIPLAALEADAVIESALPLRRAAVSRCYRAEAGARGASTKGLYRVHEFTKVELFAWTAPAPEAAVETFDALVDLQTDILSSLGLPCRVLEMPAGDLGASAFRKIDIEAFFPSRQRAGDPDSAWGEVTSASICTDYQTRRLGTRVRLPDGSLSYPWTLNGTALAVPRVLAALLEHGWDDESMTVAIPECLRPWMDGQETIGRKHW